MPPPVSPPLADVGLFGRAAASARIVASGLPVAVRLPTDGHTVAHVVGGERRVINQPCTFTPFASARPCSARCRFCSETLIHRDATRLSASLRPGADYHAQLREALAALRPVPLGFSLSGLEASDDFAWVSGVLTEAARHEASGGVWTEKVMYSNANGFDPGGHGPALLDRLVAFGLDRVEVSRHHPEAEANDAIMRFRRKAAVRSDAGFARAVRAAGERLHVRLVCVMQHGGVTDLGGVRAYLRFARGLGVTEVVFRELSRLGDLYVENKPFQYVEAQRAPLDALLDEVWPEGAGPVADFAPEGVVAGYYYYNLFGMMDGLRVTFETSDYAEMKARHHGDVVHKLVFHANGHLCADWDPNTRVLLRTGLASGALASGEASP